MTVIDESTAWTLGLTSLALVLVVYVWTALALGAVFRKSGEAAWKAWVPLLNQATLFRLGGLSGWLVLLNFLPVVGALIVWVAQIVSCHRINVDFGLGGGMTVLAALLLPVWATVLGFGSARWVGHETGSGPLRSQTDDPAAVEDRGALDESATPAQYSPIAPPPAYGRANIGTAPQAPASAVAPRVSPAPVMPALEWAEPPAGPAATGPVAPITSAPLAPSSTPQTAEAPVASPRYAPPAGTATPVPPAESAPPASVIPASAVPVPADDEPVGEQAADPLFDEPESDAAEEPQGPRRSTARTWGYEPEDLEWEVTNAVEGAPAPVAAVPPAPAASAMPPVGLPHSRDDQDEAAPETPAEAVRPAVTRVPAAPATDRSREPWAPTSDDAFPETSGPVSAVVGAPVAGGPRSARTSVSSFHTRPEIPDDAIDETIIARRRRTHWSLLLPSGEPIALGSETVLLGRRPVSDPAHPGAQLVAVDDGTVSKTHARLELRDERWYITDLGSTNGVVFTTLTGTDVEVPTGVEMEAGDRFLLGDAEVRLVRSDV